MSAIFKVWYYGTRAATTNKSKSKSSKTKGVSTPKFVRLSDDDVKNAKAFHIFVKKKSGYERLSPEPIKFPSWARSIVKKTDFISIVENFFEESFRPKKKPTRPKTTKPKAVKPKATRPKVTKPKKVERYVDEMEDQEHVDLVLRESEASIELPEIPEPKRVSLTKKQFGPIMARVIYDEIAGAGLRWSDERIDNLIDKYWKNYSHRPDLLTSELFRRGFVTQEIKYYTEAERKAFKKKGITTFSDKLNKLDIALDPDLVDGTVRVQFKESFNARGMKEENEVTMKKFVDGDWEEVDRQSAFVQVVVDYNEFIQVNADELKKGRTGLQNAISRVRKDVEKMFKDAKDKELFVFSGLPQYSIRLVTPMVDHKGNLIGEYINLKGSRQSGYGYSTKRRALTSMDDLDEMIDELFEDLPRDLARYMHLNSAAGIGFTGFMIERHLG